MTGDIWIGPTEPRSCDFCSEPASWTFPAVSFETAIRDLDGRTHVSAGGWDACDGCRFLVEDGDRLGLLDRSIDAFAAKLAVDFAGRALSEYERSVLAETLGAVHDRFFESRTGPATPL